jgi:predicted metal-dependent peptidase
MQEITVNADSTAPTEKEVALPVEKVTPEERAQNFKNMVQSGSGILNERFKDILLLCPLVGDVLLHLRREISDDIPTAAVCVDRENGGFKMLVNMDFLKPLTEEEQKAVIWHEVMHIVQKVFKRFSHLFEDKTNAYLINLATDCSINQYNRFTLPENCVTLESLQSIVGEEPILEPHRPSEYYYKILRDEVTKREQEMEKKMGENGEDGDEEGEGGGGGKSLADKLRDYAEQCNSDHESQADDMKDMNPLDAAAMESIIKKAMEKQKQHDLKAGTGAGGSVLDILPQKNVTINKQLWKNFLNKAFGESPSPEEFTLLYGRQNRRNIKIPYGKRREFEDQHLTVIIDTSGSMSDFELGLFCSHLNKAMRVENLTVDLIECDWEIQKITRNVRKFSKKGIALHGRGGTSMDKAQNWVLQNMGKRKTADVLMFTDGWTDFVHDKRLNQRVLYTENHSKIEGVEKYAVIGE